MNLLELLQQNKSYEELRSITLVINASLKSVLEAAQDTFNPQDKSNLVELTDGRFILCADLLKEIEAGRLHSQGLGLFDVDLFSQVEVFSMEEVAALLPVAK
jgi:hypothetical protein